METKRTPITDDMLASQSDRLINLIIDYLAVMAVAFVVGFISAIMNLRVDGSSAPSFFDSMNKLQEYALGVILALSYYSVCEIATGGRTIGKFVTGTITVTEDGQKPEARMLIVKSMCRLIPFEAFSFLGTPSKGWHDTLSGTRVIKKKLFVERNHKLEVFDEIEDKNELL